MKWKSINRVLIGHFQIERGYYKNNANDYCGHKVRLHTGGSYKEFDEDAFEEFLFKIYDSSPVQEAPRK